MDERRKATRLEDVLSVTQVSEVVARWCGAGAERARAVGGELRPAGEGLAGFVGDHFRLALRVARGDQLLTLPLFVKCVPLDNADKIAFIKMNKFFIRESSIFKLIEEMDIDPSNPCVAQALYSNESVVVMPDLAAAGYRVRDKARPFDLPHARAALASVARFHALSARLETRRGLTHRRPYSLLEDHDCIIVDPNFADTPWIRAGAKLTANIIRHMSDKYRDTIPNVEANVLKQFLAACDDLKESRDSLNVVLHKDLWANNIMFKYEGEAPTNAILLDFQCVRYGPPGFDVMMFLYLTTTRSFREQHEASLFEHYFKIFKESVDADTELRLKGLGYDFEEFLRWAGIGRRFGMVVTMAISPYGLMDAVSASATFDDPATYAQLTYEDRTAPVLAYAHRDPGYRRRLLEVTEEFVERCLVSY